MNRIVHHTPGEAEIVARVCDPQSNALDQAALHPAKRGLPDGVPLLWTQNMPDRFTFHKVSGPDVW